MGLIGRIFRNGASGDSKPATDFKDSEPSPGTAPDSEDLETPRRDLVHTVLRETMRKHGIPRDWMACRVLSVMSRSRRRPGLHVQFVVRKGDEQLLRYVHAFQAAFMAEIERMDPGARQWIFSVAWQFDGKPGVQAAPPQPIVTNATPGSEPDTVSEAGDTVPHVDDAVDLESDLQALYAIRDAAIATPSKPAGL